MDSTIRGHPADVVGDEPLEEFACVRAVDADQSSVRQHDEALRCRHRSSAHVIGFIHKFMD
jgi:esterase/lipase superfamily enzyme